MKSLKSFCILTVLSCTSFAAAENNSTVKLGFKKLYGNSFHEATANKEHSNDADEIALKNNQNTYYSVDITLGTPGQSVSVQLDTGSSDLWVIQPGALQCPSDSSLDLDPIDQVSDDDDGISFILGDLSQEYDDLTKAGYYAPTGSPTDGSNAYLSNYDVSSYVTSSEFQAHETTYYGSPSSEAQSLSSSSFGGPTGSPTVYSSNYDFSSYATSGFQDYGTGYYASLISGLQSFSSGSIGALTGSITASPTGSPTGSPTVYSSNEDVSSYVTSGFQDNESAFYASLMSDLEHPYLGPTGVPSGSGSRGPTKTQSVLSPSSEGSGTSGAGSTDCYVDAYFDPKKSKTFQKNDTDPYYIEYEDSSYASGYWGTDDLTIGQLKVHNMSFAVADQTNSTAPVFGIGLPGDEASFVGLESGWRAPHPHEYANFPQLLKEQGIIERVAYSLYLNSPKAVDGNILFGGVDKSQYKGELYSFPVLQLGSWGDPYSALAITLDSVSVAINGSEQSVSTSSFSVILDSGTTDMYLPYDVASSIVSKYNGVLDPDGIASFIDCPNSEDKINFSFGPLTIETDITNYISQIEGQCILNVFSSDDTGGLLGDVFLVDAYLVYDLEGKQIALAQASFDSSKEDIEPITESGIPGAKQA